MEIHEIIEVVTAYERGLRIQWRYKNLASWEAKHSFQAPKDKASWNFVDYEYRVEPLPRKWKVRLFAEGREGADGSIGVLFPPSVDGPEFITVVEKTS